MSERPPIASWIVPLLSALFALATGPVQAASAGPALAVLEAPSDTPLDEIVSGRARIGFNPVVDDGIHAIGRPGQTQWLRLRLHLPEDGVRRFLSLPRQPIDSLRLHVAGPPDEVLAEGGIGETDKAVRWPDSLVLPLPASLRGEVTVYLEVRGQGHLNLRPRLLDEAQWQSRSRSSSAAYDLLYSSLLLIVLLALLRRGLWGARTSRVAAAAFACLGAAVVGNYHLQLSLGGTSLAAIPALPVALWVIACGPLLWATQQYSGMDRSHPGLAGTLDRAGLACVLLGMALLFLPVSLLAHLQVFGLALVASCSLACAAALLTDARHGRWIPALVWIAMLPALLAIALGTGQILPSTRLVTRGFQILLTLQLAVYLFLPWWREAMAERERRRRGGPVEQSAEEKIGHAREWMIRSLQAGIENASDGDDMEWIAYRRLMGGLKPVLPQSAAAVIAMNYHSEDLLLVEPRSAEARFQLLLAHRGSLLKNLSRSLAPQQIGVDFQGADGKSEQVQLAVIPLPIERPGWGALVIERAPNTSYSDSELDLCTEFAALATTAGDEAATVMQLRRATEIEPESGVYRGGMAETLLRKAHEAASQKRKPLSVLQVSVDGFEMVSQEAAATVARLVADLIRDEIDYGDTVARVEDDRFLAVLSGRPIGDARALAERLCLAVRKLGLPIAEGTSLALSVGVSQVLMGERSAQQAVDRASKALGKAKQYGGNQVQAVAGGLG